MNNKIKILCLVVFVMILLLGIVCMYIFTHKVNVDKVEKARVDFFYNGSDICNDIEYEDLSKIKNILNGKLKHKDNPSCGFDDSVAIVMDNNETYCLAKDGCPILYIKEDDVYIQLSKNEIERLHELLEKYDVHFPCV